MAQWRHDAFYIYHLVVGPTSLFIITTYYGQNYCISTIYKKKNQIYIKQTYNISSVFFLFQNLSGI